MRVVSPHHLFLRSAGLSQRPTKERMVVFGSIDGIFVVIFTTPFKADDP